MKTYILASLSILFTCGIAACGSGSNGGSSDQGQGGQNQALVSERPQLSAMANDPTVADPYACGNAGVTICHLPPGNPAARHTLCIGAPAVAHHIAEHHRGELGDYLGACLADPSSGGDSGGTTGGTTGGTNGDGGQIIDCTNPVNQGNILCN